MKRRALPPFGHFTALSTLCLLAAFGLSAQADDYTWDTAAGNTTITEGGGTWTVGAGNWFNGGSYDQSWADGNGAIFGGGTAGTAGTVTLGGPISVTNLVFKAPFAGNYTIDTATFGLTLNSPASITNSESATLQSAVGGSVALGAAATVGVAGGKTLTVSSPMSGSATVGLTKTGNGTLELDGVITFGNNANGLTINAGVVRVGGAGAVLGNAGTGCKVINDGALIFNSSANSLVFGPCAGAGTWEQKGPGMFTFSGGATYTFTGNVTLSGGILRAAINSATPATRTNNLGAGASQLFLNGGELQCATGNNTANNADVNYGRNTTVGGSGVTLTSDRGTNAGPQGRAVTYTFGTLSIGNQTLRVQAGASGLTNGTAGIAFGDVSLTGAPTFLVSNNVANVTTLLTLGAISNDVNLVTFDGTGNTTVNGIIGGGAGTGGLAKNGSGTLTLAGANTYTGNTTISAGTLALSGSGSIASPVITVNGAFDISALLSGYSLNSGQDLSGTGAVVGNVSLAAGASLHPGGAGTAGTLTFGTNLTFDAAAMAVFDCSSSAVSGNDKVVLTNASATLNGNGATLTINQLGGVNTLATADYLLFDLTGASGSVGSGFNPTPAWTPSTPANAASYSIVTVGKQVYLKYTAPAGAPVLSIETAPTGGAFVAAQNVLPGNSVTGYAILRTSGGAFIANTNVTWSLVNTTGGVVSSNLVVAGDNKSATFTGRFVGSGQMQIALPGVTSTNSGVLTVVAGTPTQLGVETKSDGSGTAVAAQTVAVGSSVTGYAIRRDRDGNFVDNVSATWLLANKSGGVADTDLAAAGTSATFTAHLGGTATMHAVAGALAGDSGLLSVYQDLRWTGYGADWDTSSSVNWVVLPGASANSAFANHLSSVLFDDNGAATTTVNLVGSLSPTSVTVAGTTSYQFGGAGKITGATGLTNNSTGTLTLLTANDYTGGTVTTAGRIRLGNDHALGTGPVTLRGGALSSDSATARTLANALTVTANSTFGDVDNSGTLTNTGLVTWTGGGKVNTFNSDVVFAGGAVALWTANNVNNVKDGSGTLILRGGVNLSNNTRNVTFDVKEGTVILDGAKLINYGRVGVIANSGVVARLVITNGATVSQYGIGNERLGQNGAKGGTNICDLAGTFSLSDDTAGNLVFNNVGNLQELNLLPGGDTTVYAVVPEGAGSGITRFNFNGGTLRTKGNNATFFQGLTEANVQAGGAKIDATNNVTIAQPLLYGGEAGGLTKLGAGILTLSGTNTYTGLTTVSNGALWVKGSLAGPATVGAGATLGGDGAILGAVTSQAGATLSPGTNAIGTLTISNSLTLNAGSLTVMELNQTTGASDQVIGLSAVTYGGMLVVTNLDGTVTNGSQFTLFSATSSSGNFSSISGSPGANLAWSFNPANGVLSAVNGVSPTNALHVTVSGSTLTLTWPNPGWYAQSNSVDVANTNFWFDLAGSQGGTNLTITVDRARKNVFYRLRKP